jgi:acid phosphatase type 7
VVLLQALGLVVGVLRESSHLGAYFFLIRGWPEASAQLLERAGAGVVLLGSLAAVFGRGTGVRLAGGLAASLFFALLAGMEMRMGGVPFSSWALPAHASRMLAPLVLALWHRPGAAAWLARGAVAVTFLVHGVEALALHPHFIDFILVADMRIFGLGLTQSSAETLLILIGVQDLVLALLIVSGRDLRPVLAFAAFWGFVTAASRMVMGGQYATHLTLMRAANGGLPLVLLLLGTRTFMNLDTLRSGRRLARVALPALLVALALPFAAHAQSLDGARPAHLRLVWTEDPGQRATISWSTAGQGSGHDVYLDTQPRGGDLSAYAMKVPATENGAYGSGLPWYHHARVEGLSPSTKYYFVVVSDGHVSPERHFFTAPVDDRAFRLLFGGDSRSGVADRRKMNQLMARLTEQDPGIVGFAHGGDYIDIANRWTEWDSWLEDHALTFTAQGRVLPIIPAKGNHEGNGAMYNQVFGSPGGARNYFVTQLGANLSFITLDSNISMGGEQRSWLEQQLSAAQAGRWIIPSYHRPAFPAVKLPSQAREFFVPLFEKYDVDVVCESDGHVLKRTVPIRNEKHDPTGVVYIGEGGLGVPQRTPIKAWYLNSPGMAKSAHHVQIFSVTPQQLVYEARLMDGTVDDQYTFLPRRPGRVVEPEPVPEPDPDPTVEPEPVVPAAPAIESVSTYSPTQVAVTFTLDVDAQGATRPELYAIVPDIEVLAVALVSPRTVVLTTTALAEGTDYLLTVEGVPSAEGAQPSARTEVAFQLGATHVTPLPQMDDPREPGRVGCATAGGMAGWVALVALGWVAARRRRRTSGRA